MSWDPDQFIAECAQRAQPKARAPRGIIYCITNWATKQVYIGKSKRTFKERYTGGRWWQHTCNQELKADYLKYGPEVFEVDILAYDMTEEEMSIFEPALIRSHNSLHPHGYNRTLSSRGGSMSEATRLKMSDAHKGKPLTAAHRANILRAAQARKGLPSPIKGKPKTPEHKERIRQAHLRYRMTPEHRKRITEDCMGGKHHAAKAVNQLDLKTGKVIRSYPSIADAVRLAGVEETGVIRACKGRLRSSSGFGWRYAT